ncbi:iron-sulfur cluster biosynthesis family protein [Paludifilum halophilum]|uniref:Core domain-containing protein n=1 Tax=Paludifilum halophilum TaxID=1642702 RepID=A0A235B6A3_9BACL|nr:iron-sulfur cluster biosynthesis family protein [Paludifilum halophilum]OYD07820.1 hypothetical protein CHM34_10205 [Paludifilum halophilum]
MEIQVTGPAAKALRSKQGSETVAWRLAAVHAGCGCGEDLLFEMERDHPRPDDVWLKAEGIPFLIDPHSRSYLDRKLVVDYCEERGTFTLKSDSQIYRSHIRL